MTYCVGILVEQGLVVVADTRTNAGLDNVSSYRKLVTIAVPGERVIALASAGNLSLSQSVVALLQEGRESPESTAPETLHTVPSMFRAAQLVGRVIRHVRGIEGPGLEAAKLPFDLTFLVGGQIGDGRLRLFMVYAAGNFIECTNETPFLQIGEHKYGKPILDRAVAFDTRLYDALKIGLISLDSTMRSNLSVGMPLDLALIRRDALDFEVVYRIEANEPYFSDLRERWSEALRAAHTAIPQPPYGPSGSVAPPTAEASGDVARFPGARRG